MSAAASSFEEPLAPGAVVRIEAERVLHATRSAFQDLAVIETAGFGRVLLLDGFIQTTERDEFIYHEMLAHTPLFAHGAAKRVLIIGGGDGGLLEEVLKHPVERVTMVEIDPTVIEVSRAWLPTICGRAFEDPRANLVIGDGAKFVAESSATYDTILIDSPDPVGPAEVLFSHPFYEACRNRLAPGGILAGQGGLPFIHGPQVTSTFRHLTRLFPHAGVYLAPVPSYLPGYMAFAWASERDLTQAPGDLEARVVESGLSLGCYNPAVHRAAFALPNYVRELLG